MLLKFTLHSLVAGLRVAVPLVAAAGTVTAGPPVRPMLFMESRDLLSPSGKLRLVANEIQAMPELMPPKGLNYTGGDTITAAFPLEGGGAESARHSRCHCCYRLRIADACRSLRAETA
eukprot:SAG31_NODE_1988_length_6721_cov_11.339928_5_plen_118_part_00